MAFILYCPHLFVPLQAKWQFGTWVVPDERESGESPEQYLLLFDSGDFVQGSVYYTMFKGDVEVGLMNFMGYDAATIGNHEFDFGLEEMARMFRQANFPIVCSNYDFTGTPMEGIAKPYIMSPL